MSVWEFLSEFCRGTARAADGPPSFNNLAVKDGREFQAKGRRLNFGGSVSVLVLISDRGQTATLRAALCEAKRRSLLLASTSHELRTPLCSMISALENAMGEATGKEALKQLHQIALSTAKHLLSTVSDVLDYAQLGEGCLKICHESFDPRDVVKECIDMMSLDAQKKGITLALTTEASLATYRTPREIIAFLRNIYSDPKRFRQILINLMGNAMKFTPKGSITVHLQPEGAELLKCSVSDTGVGISEGLCKRLFSPYVRGYDPRGINKGGSGFGLAISKRLCERLGGRISVTSTVGSGATFTFTVSTLNTRADLKYCRNNGLSASVASAGASLGANSKDPNHASVVSDALTTNPLANSPNNSQLGERKERRCKCALVLAVDDSALNRYALKALLGRLHLQCDEV